MKKIKFLITVMFYFLVASNTQAQTKISDSDSTVVYQQVEKISDSAMMQLGIIEFCKELGIPSAYNARYEAIILPLCNAGIYLFNAKNNQYCAGVTETSKMSDGKLEICYCYVGNSVQNEILKRNILANRSLIKNGVLSMKDAKKWKAVK